MLIFHATERKTKIFRKSIPPAYGGIVYPEAPTPAKCCIILGRSPHIFVLVEYAKDSSCLPSARKQAVVTGTTTRHHLRTLVCAPPVIYHIGLGLGHAEGHFHDYPFPVAGHVPTCGANTLYAFGGTVSHQFVPRIQTPKGVAIGSEVEVAIFFNGSVVGRCGSPIGETSIVQVLRHPTLGPDQSGRVRLSISCIHQNITASPNREGEFDIHKIDGTTTRIGHRPA